MGIRVAATAVMLLVSLPALVGQVSAPPFLLKWGGFGTLSGRFNTPVGVTVDAAGNVYVADRMNHRVQKFTSDGTFLTAWGSLGSADGQFTEPFGVAVDAAGNVYVSDVIAHRIQKFTSTGTFLRKWGSLGSADGQFRSPSGIAVDPTGNLYVAEQLNHRVQKFASDGTFLTKWGRLGSANGEFNIPMDVGVDASGNVYVGEFGGHRVQKFDPAGAFVTRWGSLGSADGQFTQVGGVEVDGLGNVYVTDRHNRVQQFDEAGQFLVKWGTLGSADGQFNVPGDVAADRLGGVFVVDRFNHRVQRFGYAAPVNHPPVADAGPDQLRECGVPTGALAVLDASRSSDPDGDPLQFAWTVASVGIGQQAIVTHTFPLGLGTAMVTVMDPSGASASDTASIVVADTTPPGIARASAQPGHVWPPNGRMVAAQIQVQATDTCDVAPTCRVTNVTSNEPVVAFDDWSITGPLTVQVKADRLGKGNGRVYTVDVQCTDATGNSSVGTATITVPKTPR